MTAYGEQPLASLSLRLASPIHKNQVDTSEQWHTEVLLLLTSVYNTAISRARQESSV